MSHKKVRIPLPTHPDILSGKSSWLCLLEELNNHEHICCDCGTSLLNKDERHDCTYGRRVRVPCTWPGCSFLSQSAAEDHSHRLQHKAKHVLTCPYSACSFVAIKDPTRPTLADSHMDDHLGDHLAQPDPDVDLSSAFPAFDDSLCVDGGPCGGAQVASTSTHGTNMSLPPYDPALRFLDELEPSSDYDDFDGGGDEAWY